MMKLRLLVILLVCSVPVSAQVQSKVDSLMELLEHAKIKAKLYNELAYLYSSSDPAKCLEYALKGYEFAVAEKNDKQIAESFWFQARMFSIQNEKTKCAALIDSAKKYYERAGEPTSVINCDVFKANSVMLSGEYDSALIIFQNCLDEIKKLNDKPIEASIQVNIGRIYWARGNSKEALNFFLDALEIAEKLDHAELLPSVYYFVGVAYQDQNKYDLAIEYFLKALPLYEKTKNSTQLPYLYSSLGTAYRDNKNANESLKYYRKALLYLTTNNDRWGINDVSSQMGLAYLQLNKLDSAQYYFEKSLQLSREINEKAGESNALHYLGEIATNRKEYKKAIHYLKQALELNAEVVNQYTRCRMLISLGSCQTDMGSLSAGLKTLNQALNIADSMNLMREQMMVHEALSDAYSKKGNYKEALVHHKEHSQISDSLFRAESNLHFLELERKYQSEKQKQEISQLQLDVYDKEETLRKQRTMRNLLIGGFLFVSIIVIVLYRSYRIQKRADQEKEALLKEIHHRVKNNLQIISSLLSIQTESLKDAKIISAVQESQSRVKAMGLIHQLLYQDDDLRSINFETYLPQLINGISSIFKNEGSEVKTHIEANKLSFEIDTAIPLGLMIAELSSNAFKYAFTGKKEGKLDIRIDKEADAHFRLTVMDNGPGMPENTQIEELESMGLRLVKMLTSQLDGILSYTYNQGAQFTVKFSTT